MLELSNCVESTITVVMIAMAHDHLLVQDEGIEPLDRPTVPKELVVALPLS